MRHALPAYLYEAPMPLLHDQRTRLTKLLGMTGSTHDGEALNALRHAQRLMKEAKVNWEDTLHGNGLLTYREGFQEGRTAGFEEGYAKGYREGQNAPRARPQAWQGVVREMLEEHADDLNDRETEFLESFRRRSWHTPTERQRAWITSIANKLGVEIPDTGD